MKVTKKRVLIVDDSAAVRQTLCGILDAHNELEVIGVAADPLYARERIRKETPDVIVLDIEMPRMDGLTFLRRLMAQHPIPVVVCSSLVGAGSATLAAVMDAGAVNVIPKPALAATDRLMDLRAEIQNAVLSAAKTRVDRLNPVRQRSNQSADCILRLNKRGPMIQTTDRVIAIGASTGGTESVRRVLEALPPFAPPIVIVQHMPAEFTRAFAKRLDEKCSLSVREAKTGDSVIRGTALIAPGGYHMVLTRSGANYGVAVKDGPIVNRHKPSVDVLFRSAAMVAGANAVGIIMTGMGDDGARGLKEMRDAGARTLGQSEATCVVYGMPAEAKKRGAVEREVGLDDLAGMIMRLDENRDTAAQ